ncbi:MAG: DUF2207 domain-containing protein [Synergistaceae bacterium]|nr:DUF2207 domain-containing protein [Synergistaceae bacterium]
MRFSIVFAMAGIFSLIAVTPGKACGEGTVIEDLSVLATVTKGSILSVEETLIVFFDGLPLSEDLTRGISRRYVRDGYEKNKTGFVLLDATLDGQPAKTDIQRRTDSLRLTLARRGGGFMSAPMWGRHVFKLKYELINMISFFDPENAQEYSLEGMPADQDLLIWNLVQGSSCPILRISVEVKLPDPESTEKEGPAFGLFTGHMSTLDRGESIHTERPGALSTTAELPEGSDFTLYMSWDKGFVMGTHQNVSPWRYLDLGAMILLTIYYAYTWWAYGRLFKRQTAPLSVIPPANLSPGLLRYLRDMRPSARILTAEILNLAVKGYIRLDNAEDAADGKKDERKDERKTPVRQSYYSTLERMMSRKYRLRPNDSSLNSPALTATEKILLHNLFAQGGEPVVLDESCAARLKTAFRALIRSFSDVGKRFFFQHMGRWVLGLVCFEAYTGFIMFQNLSQGVGGIEPSSEHALAFMAPLFFLTPLLGGETLWRQSTPMFILRTGIPLFFCACSLTLLHQQGMDSLSIATLAGSIAVIGFFWEIAPSRSEEGQKLLGEIEGFQLGLGSRAELREQDNIEKFESLLPYAYALGLEQPLIARYDPLISPLRHRAKWHTNASHSLSSGAEHYTLTYELGEAIKTFLSDLSDLSD